MSPVTDLIVGTKTDYHAIAVMWALKQLGRSPLLWDGLSIDDGHMHLAIDGGRSSLALNGHQVETLHSLWFRRQIPYKEFANVTPEAHKFLKRELYEADRVLCAFLEKISKFTVCGSPSKVALSKVHQLQVARDVGFRVPKTLITNQFDAVRSFVTGTRSIVKHFAPHYFMRRDHSQLRVVGTSEVGELMDIDPRSVEIAPAIYQERVDKSYEVRLTVVGDKLFPAKIFSDDGDAFLDWRSELGKAHCKVAPCKLGPQVEQSALRLMRRLNLEYGCIDLAVSKLDEIYFLEVNPGGQFLFIEDLIPEYPILHAFCSLLAQGRRDFALNDTWRSKLTMRAFERSDDFYEWEQVYARKDDDHFITYIG
ncbi:ATP-grasp domain-containing protein [Dyella flagellata]|uniref:ATP-grasp domain-containing protein n=1 Tax=Dyella flagellata TaxID=1867833 RepID=A0ABQ5XCT2_9GAMM|nr:hypothetical protein [Dyella flagellata]GLQ89127.1 hypothetical protein GCM10007898_26990 [Dyella flagellata]